MTSHRAYRPTLAESLWDAFLGFLFGFAAATIAWLITLWVMANT